MRRRLVGVRDRVHNLPTGQKGGMAAEIIGRREERLTLEAFLTDIPAGGQALLLEGDPGIGKTALWEMGLRAARERGIQVLRARPSDSEAQIAFAALGDLVAPALASELPRLVPLQGRALETALLLRESEGAPPDVRVLGLALLSIMRSLARKAPLLIAIDDVQWLDASSADVLTFALRRVEAEPIAVLATVRGRQAEMPLALDRAFSEFCRVPIGPLSVGAIHRVLWGRLGLALPRPALVRVHRTTGGNAFYALEVGRALADGTIHPDSVDEALPESLRAIVAQRLSTLPDRVRETLVAVAALGSPTVTVLKPLGEGVVENIELAHRRHVLELDGDRIRFAHPLLAPACYEAMPLHRRRLVHEQLAGLEVDPEERARHLAIAAEGPNEEVAAALDSAATHAAARGAGHEAAELAERAVTLTPSTQVDDLNRRRITAATRCVHAGDVKKAAGLLQRAADSADPGPLRAEALYQLADVRGQTEGHRVSIELLERALAEPGVEAHRRAAILESLAWKASVSGDSRDSERALGWAEAGLALAEDLGEPETLVDSLTTVADIEFWRTGHIRRDLLDRAIQIRAKTGGEVDPRVTLAHQLGRADHFREARKIWEELIAEARAQFSPGLRTRLLFLARMEVGSGRWNAATRLSDELMDVAQQTGEEAIESLSLMTQAEIDAYRGEETVRTTIPELLGIAANFGYGGAAHRLQRALASLELSVGDAGASWHGLEPLLADLEQMDEVSAQLAGSVGIETLIAVDDLPAADRLLGLLAERAAGSDTALRAFADRGRGLLLSAQGEQERAIAALEAAAVEPEPPQEANPFELARTLQLLGTAQRRAQHKRAARETLERSLTIFEALGARLWAEKARSELRRIGGRTASDSELSETERRIVELVVAGRKNREVAEELSLSPNTVAWNLSKIYRKVGVRSRTELAAHISERA
jgi:DNA-binding NarL/FixJ family response regulator